MPSVDDATLQAQLSGNSADEEEETKVTSMVPPVDEATSRVITKGNFDLEKEETKLE